MKLILLSDTHLLRDKPISRLDNTYETQFIKLEFIFEYAKKYDAKIIIAGDIFNKPRSWHLLPKMIDFLKKYNIKVYVVYGQHDVYLYSNLSKDKTNLGILAKAGLVTVLNEEPFYDFDIAFYGCSYGQEIPKIKNKKCFNILVIHAPIAEKALYPNQNYLDSLKLLKDNPFDLIVAGDIHQKFINIFKGRFICNSGPLIRKESTIYNFSHKPGFFLFDTNNLENTVFVEVPHKPAEEVLTRTHIDYEKENDSILQDFISSIETNNLEDGVDFMENLWLFIKSNDIPKTVIEILSEVTNYSTRLY